MAVSAYPDQDGSPGRLNGHLVHFETARQERVVDQRFHAKGAQRAKWNRCSRTVTVDFPRVRQYAQRSKPITSGVLDAAERPSRARCPAGSTRTCFGEQIDKKPEGDQLTKPSPESDQAQGRPTTAAGLEPATSWFVG